MADFTELRDRLVSARDATAEVRDQLYSEGQALRAIEAERAALDRIFDPHNREHIARRGQLEQAREKIRQNIARLRDNQARLSAAEAGVLREFGRVSDPREQIRGFRDEFPFLMLPVRMETRWKTVAGGRTQLWVRIYPDECAVDTFEPRLTGAEIESARQYWIEIWRAGGIEGQERAAWRALVASSGSGRAQWIVESFRPVNIAQKPAKTDPDGIVLVIAGDPPLAGADETAAFDYWKDAYIAGGNAGQIDAARQRLETAVGAARAEEIVQSYRPVNFDQARTPATAPVQAAALALPSGDGTEKKETNWSKAPVVRVLPDRFVLIGYNGAAEAFTAVGNPIPSPLVAGPDPSAAPEDQLKNDDSGELVIPDDMKWMVDFDRAVETGMGFRIDVNPAQARTGYTRLLAIGIRLTADERGGQALVEDLLRHHQRTRKGFSFLRQGTPTNNTDGKGSGYSRVDDADVSFDDIFKPRVPIPGTDPFATRFDGQWFADYLGIDPEAVRTANGFNFSDQCEARAMNQALWPATLGYWMDSMMHPVFTASDIERTRAYFTNFVSGRGPIPAIRIGAQPYGIVPATAFSRMNWLSSGRFPAVRVFDDAAPSSDYLAQLYGVLRKMDADWTNLSKSVSFVGKAGDAHQLLLDIVGLHPGSVEYHQRYAESLEHLFNMFNFGGLGGALVAALIAAGYLQSGLTLLAQLGRSGGPPPDILNKFFLTSQNLLKGPVVDVGEFSESDGIRPSTEDGHNYIQWLIDAAHTSLEAVRQERGFKDGKTPAALLYIYLRHAVMLGYWETSLRLHQDADIVLPAAVSREPAFVHVAQAGQAQPSESRFSYLYKAEKRITDSDTLLLSDYIARVIPVSPVARYLRVQLEALEYLKSLPTARLERAFAEHIDCCSYRLDAWLLGLVKYQLALMRYRSSPTTAVAAGGAFTQRGLYLGAFGWLEEVKPENKALTPVELDDELKPIFDKPGEPPPMRDASNGGFIHAPSLNHAVTAAVLRNGYLANATPANPQTMAVNLSSDRVRLAISILEGIRGGQSAGALLGYRFERGLHDRHNEAEVDQFIFRMRRAFPLRANQIPGTKTNEEGVSIEAIEARNVLDGVKLVEHIRRTGNRTYPYGVALLTHLPQPSLGQARAINAETDALLDLYDALADLALAEGVHQAVQGNYDRVAATLDAYSKGNFPPEPAVAQTPRSGIALTHRVGLHLTPGLGGGATARSKTEPALNNWLRNVMPAQGDVFCRVGYSDPVTAAPVSVDVSLADLNLEPMDLLYLVRLESEQAMAELDDRVLRFVQLTAPPRPDAAMKISFLEKPANKLGVFELSPMVDSLRSLVLRSRPLRATDVALQTESKESQDVSAAIDKTRITHLQTSLTALRGSLQSYADGLKALFDDLDNKKAQIIADIDASIASLVELLSAASLLGIPQTGWGFLYDWRRQTFASVIDKVRAVVTRWEARLTQFDGLIIDYGNLPGTATEEERIELLRSAERLISTQPVNPLPADPDDFRNDLLAARGLFNARLGLLRTNVVGRATTRLADMLAQLRPLLPLTDFDLEDLVPDPTDDAIVTFASDLMNRAASIAAEASKRLNAVSALITEHDGTTDAPKRVQVLTSAARVALGDDFAVIPEFTITSEQGTEWNSALLASGDLLRFLTDPPNEMPFPVDTWMYGAARVRPKIGAWERLAMLTEALSNKDLRLEAIQLPVAAGDRWLALEYPPDLAVSGDRLLYTAHYSTAFNRLAPQCGLLLDEWSEVIPGESENTGITFNYDRPNTEAPQAMLLVTPASFTGSWQWADLVDALNETFDMAKKRAVEPVHVDDTEYARFLPATVMAATLYPISISANLAVNNNVLAQVQR